MKKVKIERTTELKLTGIYGFIRRKVTAFGNGAKVNCPKEYLGRDVYLVVLEDEENDRSRREQETKKR